MKKIQIISFIGEDQLRINATEYKKDATRYYRIEGNLIELIYLETEWLSQITYMPLSKANQHILLIKEMTPELEEQINRKFINTDILIFTGIKLGHSSHVPIIEMQQLNSSQRFELNSLIFLLNQKSMLSTLKNNHTVQLLLTGETTETELVSTIVIQTLNQLSRIHQARKLKVYLFTPLELSLTDLALIEDPIKEYLTTQSFEIEQFRQYYQSNDVCYAICLSNI